MAHPYSTPPGFGLPGLVESRPPGSSTSTPHQRRRDNNNNNNNNTSSYRKRPATDDIEQFDPADDDEAPYDKSHLPEFVVVGGRRLHRDTIPDDLAFAITEMGLDDKQNNDQKATTGKVASKEAETSSDDSSDTDSSDSDSDSSSDESTTHPTAAAPVVIPTATTENVEPENQEDKTNSAEKDQTSATEVKEEATGSNLATKQEDNDSSSDSSDDDDDDDDPIDYNDALEQAKMLMAEDQDDDNDYDPRNVSYPKVEKPNITLTPEDAIEILGKVEMIVENMLLVKSIPVHGRRIPDCGTVLCTEARTLVGTIDDIIGQTNEPYYSIAFNGPAEIAAEGHKAGDMIYYVPKHAMYTPTDQLFMEKHTDAAGEEGEEDAEVEFSDDEAEAEFRRQRRAQKQHAGGGDGNRGTQPRGRGSHGPGNSHRGDRGGFNRGRGRGPGGRGRGSRGGGPGQFGGRPSSTADTSYPSQPMSYDDDAPYVKLSRPGAAQAQLPPQPPPPAVAPPAPYPWMGGFPYNPGAFPVLPSPQQAASYGFAPPPPPPVPQQAAWYPQMFPPQPPQPGSQWPAQPPAPAPVSPQNAAMYQYMYNQQQQPGSGGANNGNPNQR